MSYIYQESQLIEIISKIQNQEKFILICPDEVTAQNIFEKLNTLERNKKITYLPGYFAMGVHRYESTKNVLAKRISVAFDLLFEKLSSCFVTTLSGLCRQFPQFQWIKENSILIQENEEHDIDDLLCYLKKSVYCEVQKVEEIGDYAIRGSILDFWSPQEKHPTRVEFNENTVQKIRSFQSFNQRSFQSLKSVYLCPSREFQWPDNIQESMEKLNSYLLSQKISGTFRLNYLEELKDNIPFPGIDDIFQFFSFHPLSTFYDEILRLNPDFQVVTLFDKATIEKSKKSIQDLYTNSYESATSRNLISVKKEIVFPILEQMNPHSLLESNFDFPDPLWFKNLSQKKSKERIQLIRNFYDENNFSFIFLIRNKESFYDFSLVLGSKFPEIHGVEAEKIQYFDLQLLLNSEKIDFQKKSISFYIADVQEGFFIPNKNAFVISENWARGIHHGKELEFFEKEENNLEQKSNLQAFLSTQVIDFNEDDYVVHIQYGIAVYRGLVSVTLMNITSDFLLLEFENSDKIYVPVHKMSLVQKYIGAKDSTKLDSLQGTQWKKRKEKAKKDIEKIAKELMEHQAKRSMTPGYAFSKISEDYLNFVDSFPYEETSDQVKSIHEIMKDMGLPKAMDRLLCGDVGFGKTEVAMRAAYRSILDNKQVAWLAPTTVLAHQHHRSLQERLHQFGVQTVLFDRSVTSSSQLLTDLKNGKIDIIVGTHRLLSKDIVFKDLGLLIIDEEQRFGVTQKEKIKAMSYGVDVLTMTATPIPRTLQMAMVGLRDLSLLATPPKARLATKTYVCPFDDQTIQQAIQFEIQRGGQIFYVHNRVEKLNQVYPYLMNLVPNLKIAIGHGQMTQNELEKTILDFLDGKYQLLLCTTIIESGVDMPNVNTIIVQDADHFGLAQLYQLRGRVGRRSSQGYAYFLTNGKLNENSLGHQRLKVLQDHQSLGSGFIVATHDMELRGSGNIVGDEQSGRMNEIGLETYLTMLDESIKELGGAKVKVHQEIELSFPVPLLVPKNYVSDTKERLRIYRRFFASNSENLLNQLITECEDRFGPLPAELKNLSEAARIRRQLFFIGATSLSVLKDFTEIKLDPTIFQDKDADKFAAQLFEVCNLKIKNMRLTPDGKILIPITTKDFEKNKENAFQEIKRVLGMLILDR